MQIRTRSNMPPLLLDILQNRQLRGLMLLGLGSRSCRSATPYQRITGRRRKQLLQELIWVRSMLGTEEEASRTEETTEAIQTITEVVAEVSTQTIAGEVASKTIEVKEEAETSEKDKTAETKRTSNKMKASSRHLNQTKLVTSTLNR